MNRSTRVGIGTLLFSTSACALAQQPAPQHIVEKAVVLNLAPSPLEDALHEFSRATGLKVMLYTVLRRGIISPRVSGTLTPGAALDLLLKGAALRFEYLDSQTIAVLPARNQSPDATGRPMSRIESDRIRTASALESAGATDTSTLSFAKNERAPAADHDSDNRAKNNHQNELEEVVVTAQKREERLQDVPMSISVLTGPHLETPTINSVNDALGMMPGVATNESYNGGGTVVAIRGVSIGQALFAGSSPVAYYIDSMPFGLVKSAIAPDENVYDLQRIEVLRGPQGTLYGASALNGVVRVLTNDADLNGFDIKVRGSDSYTDGGGNNYRGDLAVNVPILDGKLASRAVMGYEIDSGYIDTPVKNDVNDATLRNYRLKITAQPTDDVSIGLSYWGERDHYGAPSTGDDNYKNSSVHDQPVDTVFDAYAIKVGHSASGYSLSSATSYLNYFDNADFDFSSLVGFPIVFFTGLNSRVFSEEILWNSPSDGTWRWSVGGMYRRATENRFQYIPLLGQSVLDPTTGFSIAQDDTSKSFAGYGQITRVFLGGRFEATVGLRQFEDRVAQEGQLAPTGPLIRAEGRFHATTPRAVLTWHAQDNLMIYGSYSQEFRSGFPQDVSVPASIGPAQADKLYNYEAGAKGSLWDDRANFDMAVYYMNWEHVQQLLNVPFGNIYTTAVVNGQSASGEGVEISLTSQPVDGLTLGISGSWNGLKMDRPVYSSGVLLFHKGDRLSMSPETTAGASAGYTFALGGGGLTGRLSAAVNYTSAQTYLANPGGSTIVVGTGNPMVVGRVATSIESAGHWAVTLFVNNVNNERGALIRPYLVPELTSRIRPRTVGAQLEYKFK